MDHGRRRYELQRVVAHHNPKGLVSFVSKHSTPADIDKALHQGHRGGLHLTHNGTQMSTSWFHTPAQYKNALKVAYHTSDDVVRHPA